jgi:ADP-heptose:LPS heptosyltransferase
MRILLTQLRRIGDVLMTTPAVRALRQAYPEARIVYLTEPPSDELFRHNRNVDEVWIARRGAGWRGRLTLLSRLRAERFDLAIDFFSSPYSAALTRLSGARRRIGFAFRGRAWFYTDAVPLPELRQYAALDKAALLEPLGIGVESPLPEVPLGEEERAYAARLLDSLGVKQGELLVALCPVSRQPYKVWPLQRYAALADELVSRHGARILFVWGPGEESEVATVRAAMREPALPDYPTPGLLELTALLERCTLYVGNDAGPRHLAIAAGTPTVGVFGRPFPENWTPPGAARDRTAAHDPGCKRACTYPACRHLNCINGVTLEAVRAATEGLLDEIRHAGPV